MDSIGEWRPIEPASTPVPQGGRPAGPAGLVIGWRTLALVLAAAATTVIGAGAWWTSAARPALVISAESDKPSGSPGVAVGQEQLVIDVEGAVMQPGLQLLPANSRVGDAIAAAGGYSPQVDIAGAAELLNLAERLTDGAKVTVPVRGDPAPLPTSAGPADGDGGGLIDVNTASEAQLETLPGIGPVTAGEIIAAREEAPFATIDDLLARQVVGPATFEKIRPLITAGG